MSSRLLVLGFASLLCACSSSTDADEGGDGPTGVDPSERPEGFDFSFDSVEFTLEPGEERYLCTTMDVERDIHFNRWKIGDYQTVHHMFLANDIGPKTESVYECPELFRVTWMPLFTTGAGHVTLDLPENTAFSVPADARLVMQLHLVNSTPRAVTEKVTVYAKTLTESEKESEANLYAFGTTVIDIPPRSTHEIVHECVMDRSMDAFVVMPHMHQLGVETIFEVGETKDTMKVAWQGPWDFDDQKLVPAEIQLREGMHTRLRCRYENPYDMKIEYGESSFTEMCFFSVFAKDIEPLNGCVDLTNLELPF